MAKSSDTTAMSQDEVLIALFLGATDMIEIIEENNTACIEMKEEENVWKL